MGGGVFLQQKISFIHQTASLMLNWQAHLHAPLHYVCFPMHVLEQKIQGILSILQDMILQQ
tara:strand:+ start:208 stop:390 length:183 start_codon:yes stop_codon:yes gene_type:complete